MFDNLQANPLWKKSEQVAGGRADLGGYSYQEELSGVLQCSAFSQGVYFSWVCVLYTIPQTVLCLVAQSHPTLCNPRDCSPARLLCPWRCSRPECWSGLPGPPPGDFPSPGIEPGSPVLQSDWLLTELPGEPIFLKLVLSQSFFKIS